MSNEKKIIDLVPVYCKFDGFWFTRVGFKDYVYEIPDPNDEDSTDWPLILNYKPKNFQTLDAFDKPECNDGRVKELHLSIHPDFQAQGFAERMIVGALEDKALVINESDPFWLSYARIHNDHVYKVIEKLKKNPKLTVTEIVDDKHGPIGVVIALERNYALEVMGPIWWAAIKDKMLEARKASE